MRLKKVLMALVFVFLLSAMAETRLISTVRAEATEGGTSTGSGYLVEEGLVEGVGTYFEVINSPYLNITLSSTESVRLILESVPRVVSFLIESNSSTNSTVLTLTGFEPSTTYYRYQDGFLGESFTTDFSGGYTYTQDISQNHHIYIQESESTLNIYADYTFTQDIYDEIYVGADNITIDGNGYTLQGPGYGFGGFYLRGRRGVTIKNVTIKGFTHGIHMYYSEFNTFVNNTVSYNYWSGITLWLSPNNTFVNNTITNNGDRGFIMFYSGPNTLRNNKIACNRRNFGSRGGKLEWLAHDVDASNTVDGKPIYYLINQSNIIVDPSAFPNAGYLALVNSVNVTVKDMYLTGNREGVLFAHTLNSTIENVTVSSNQYGLHLFDSDYNIIRENTLSYNWWGIILRYETPWFYPPASSDNKIYHNDFICNSPFQAAGIFSANSWDDGYPSGGNYWSDYTGVDKYSGVNQDQPGSDGIGDTPYRVWPLIYNVYDRYPFMQPLHLPPQIEKLTVRVAWLKYSIDWNCQPSVADLLWCHQLKPFGWKIEWGVVDLKLAPKEDFSQYDLIIATGRQNYTMTSEDNEKLSYFVENGGTLWIDTDGGLQTLDFFMPIEFARYKVDLWKAGYRVEDIIAPDHPLIKGIYTITPDAANRLGGTYYRNYFDVITTRDPGYLEILRDHSMDNPATLAKEYGEGKIVITAQSILYGIQWHEPEDVKLAYNIMAWALRAHATIDIDPDTLNLKSNGEWITAYIELPDRYGINDIDVSSILLNGTISVDLAAPTQIGDYDEDGVLDLMVKFDRSAVIAWLGAADCEGETGKSLEASLTLTGTVIGVTFEGTDTVTVLLKR